MSEVKTLCERLAQSLKTPQASDAATLELLRRLSVNMYPVRGDRMLEYLRYTGAVPLVKQIRRDCSKEVSGFASRLLDSWKEVLIHALGGNAAAARSAPRRFVKAPDGKTVSVSSSSSDSSESSTEEESEVEAAPRKKPVAACALLACAPFAAWVPSKRPLRRVLPRVQARGGTARERSHIQRGFGGRDFEQVAKGSGVA